MPEEDIKVSLLRNKDIVLKQPNVRVRGRMWEFEKETESEKDLFKDRSRKTRSAPTLGACSSNQGHAQDCGGASNPTTLPRRKQPGSIIIQGCQSPTRRDLLSRLLRFLTLSQILKTLHHRVNHLQKCASSQTDSSDESGSPKVCLIPN